MDDEQIGTSRRPASRVMPATIVTGLILMTAALALGLAAWGWWLELADDGRKPLDVLSRTIKVLILSDIYEVTAVRADADAILKVARAMGVLAYVLVGLRLLLIDYGKAFAELMYRRAARRHHVIVGMGPAAIEYAANHRHLFPKARAIHLADEGAPLARHLGTFARRGGLARQLKAAVAGRACRILVDEGDDADTWQTAQAIARNLPDTEVLAHITDPWMRDRLSREHPHFGLSAFSYAGGAARQVMLAHPPFLLAEKLGAPVQHILIVGFGQVGQSLVREFIVTATMPGEDRPKVTIVDPDAERLSADFESRHEELVKAIDFAFVKGDFRLNSNDLFERIRARNGEAAICGVYVAIDLDHRPLGLALAIRAMATQKGLFLAPIFVCAQHGAGLNAVRQGAGLVSAAPGDQERLERDAIMGSRLCNLHVTSFGSWPDAFDGAGLLEPMFDGQARQFHEKYEKLRLEKEKRDNPAAVAQPGKPWAALEDQFRVSNRRVAAHMRAKAKAAGFDLGDWLDKRETSERWRTHDLPPAGDRFSIDDPNFMHRMAKFEHTRWMLDRYLDGWKYGVKKDNYMRIRPELVAFDKLDADNVHKDDEVIRTTKALLDGVKARGGRRA